MYPYVYIVLPTYGMLAFIGGFAAVVMVFYRMDKYKIEFGDFIKMLIVCIIGGFCGSKLLFILTNIGNIFKEFTVSNIGKLIIQSGFVYYGGLFGVLFGIYIYTSYWKKYELTNVYNMIAPAIPLFHGFGRIGCLFAGCCYGMELKPPVLLWNRIQINSFPTQIVEAIFEFCLCVVLLLIEKKKMSNHLLNVYMISYGIFRFLIEFFRGDEVRGIFFGLSTSQWISLMVLFYFTCRHLKKKRGCV